MIAYGLFLGLVALIVVLAIVRRPPSDEDPS
jgi:hypothetical protein